MNIFKNGLCVYFHGAKKRRALKKKKDLEALSFGSKAETIIQDATGLTGTHPTEGVRSTECVPESQDKPVKEDIDNVVNVAELLQEGSEVNLLVPGLKEKKAIPGVSFEAFKDHKAKDVSASQSSSANIKEVVLPLQIKDVDMKDNIEEDVERIQDVVVTDNVIKQDTPEIFTENFSEEFPLQNFDSDLLPFFVPIEKEGFTNPTLSFHIHTAGLDFPTADERIHDAVIVDNVVNTKASTEDLSEEEFPVHDDAVPSDLPTSILPMEKVENPLPQADQEDEIVTVNLPSNDGTKGTSTADQSCLEFTPALDGELSGKENILEDEKDVEIKKKLQMMMEVCCKFKKIVEEQLNASNKFGEMLLKTLDELNAIQFLITLILFSS